MELIQLLEVSAAVACPGLTTVQQRGKDHSSVDSNVCCLGDASLSPKTCPKMPKSTACFEQSAGYFTVQAGAG
ncbi:hypothetical protein ACOMHN_015369 [Nucella lapillus]